MGVFLSIDVRKTDLDDVTDLEPILRAAVSKAKSHPGRGQQDDGSAGEVEELTQMCEVLRHFDLVAGGVRALLQEAYSEQLKKYCLSFEQEGRGLDLPILRYGFQLDVPNYTAMIHKYSNDKLNGWIQGGGGS